MGSQSIGPRRPVTHSFRRRTVVAEEAAARGDEIHFGMGAQELRLRVNAARNGDIVGIVSYEYLPSHLGESSIQSRHETESGLVEDSNPRIDAGEVIEELRRLIVRSVVDRDHFDVTQGVAEQSVECRWQSRGGVSNREQDGGGGEHQEEGDGPPGGRPVGNL